MKPKKLVREATQQVVKQDEIEIITDQTELNKLYDLKIREELNEIKLSGHTDINEFADLAQAVFDFADMNGIDPVKLTDAMEKKFHQKGRFSNLALNNLNPENPSNSIYFQECEHPFWRCCKNL